MPNVQVFAWCTLSAVIGFIAGQLSPSAVSSSPPLASPSPARQASSAREAPPSPARRTNTPLDRDKEPPIDRAPSAETIARRLARPPAVAEAAPPAAADEAPPPTAEATAPIRRASVLSSFRFAGFGPHGGVRLGRVTRGSIPELLGLKTGDELITLNGFRIADPQQALQAYARLPYVDDWVVSLHRGGAQTEVRYALR
jgi:general secretion pathway protein C